jgi:Flp pilus assembly protein TadD
VVQVGDHARADRYAYVPLIGAYWVLAWGGAEAAARLRVPRAAAAAAAAAALLALAAVSWVQIGYWRDSVALFTRAVTVNERDWMSENLLGLALAYSGRPEEGLVHVRRAAAIQPGSAYVDMNARIVEYLLAQKSRGAPPPNAGALRRGIR